MDDLGVCLVELGQIGGLVDKVQKQVTRCRGVNGPVNHWFRKN